MGFNTNLYKDSSRTNNNTFLRKDSLYSILMYCNYSWYYFLRSALSTAKIFLHLDQISIKDQLHDSIAHSNIFIRVYLEKIKVIFAKIPNIVSQI